MTLKLKLVLLFVVISSEVIFISGEECIAADKDTSNTNGGCGCSITSRTKSESLQEQSEDMSGNHDSVGHESPSWKYSEHANDNNNNNAQMDDKWDTNDERRSDNNNNIHNKNDNKSDSKKMNGKRSNRSEKNRTHQMVLIPGGVFKMGTNNPVIPADGEDPARWVQLDDFYMDVYEVTNAEFEHFVLANDYITEVRKLHIVFLFQILSLQIFFFFFIKLNFFSCKIILLYKFLEIFWLFMNVSVQ